MELYDNTAVIIQVPPDWRGNVTVEWEFKTDIFVARDGNETRRALRDKPRKTFEWTVHCTHENGREMADLLAGSLRADMIMADFTRQYEMDYAAGSLLSINMFGAVPYWARTGYPIAVKTAGLIQVRKIVSTIDNVIDLDAPVDVDPYSVLMPAIQGNIREDSVISKLTTTVGTFAFRFEEDPVKMLNPIDPLLAEDIDTYRKYAILSFVPNWSGGAKSKFKRVANTIDYGFGRVNDLLLEEEARWYGDYTSTSRTPEEAERAARFFCGRKGQRTPFYASTWQKDFEVIDGMTTGSEALIVAGRTAFDLFDGSKIYRNIAISTQTGVVCVGVERVESSGVNTVLRLDKPLPASVLATSFVSWLIQCRFSTDQFSVTWYTSEVAEYDMNVQSLYDQFFELVIGGYRIQFNGDYVTMGGDTGTPVGIDFAVLTIAGEQILISGDYIGYDV